jgi:hypothetical protein
MNYKNAIKDIDGQIKQLEEARKVLAGLSGGGRKGTGTSTMSAAGRRRIAAAQRKRWAKIRAAKK